MIRWNLSGNAIAQRIKATLGITGLSLPRVHIDGVVWHLDVGSSHPGAGVGAKGWAVRPLKRYASWVQNVAETVQCLSGAGVRDLRGAVLSTREDGWTTGVSVAPPGARQSSQVRTG